jgi:hypothetical protein
MPETSKGPSPGTTDLSGYGLFKQNNSPRSTKPHGEQQRLVIIIAPVDQRGGFSARLNGRLLVTSRTPFLDAARCLIAEGSDPFSIIVMRHAGSEIDALRARLGVAAGLIIEERNARAPRFVPYRARDLTEGSRRTPAGGPAGPVVPEPAE